MSENETTPTTTTTETTPEVKTETTPVEEKKETTSIFGSAFTGSASNTTTESSSEPKEENAPDHEPNVEFTPKLNLTKQETKTNEEDEEVLFEMRAKLFRFVTDPQPQWNERGVGVVKLLKHKETKKIRVSMRREKVLKVCLNHYVSPYLKLEANMGSDKSWVWKCPKDYSDEEHPDGVEETFAIRFGSAENANAFKDQFEAAQKEMKELYNIKD
ncbi:Ran binding protein 1 domain-containing protein [Heterostelium album PN500]|uniref:Ran binding protein 1 domain-containing protein n=1 Tax=Heterostelium pallidum (strain ATCC 26659 / Pp 5 / PN500) TaxID=670386 RepID=D3B1Q8_HETP5|nr:Ran binding protein 1 domain-containing protein [Heterostelium album PN500]EFA85232.1 Ran binding protein 1 domain-containing protein [Heterostelium album PN500]|eukprot:XP_020437341.1 Ran binding protein 1 domain-containing protein [Heterostelium album PN500]